MSNCCLVFTTSYLFNLALMISQAPSVKQAHAILTLQLCSLPPEVRQPRRCAKPSHSHANSQDYAVPMLFREGDIILISDMLP